MAPPSTLEHLAHSILGFLTAGLAHPLGIGSFSAAIYDTAWVAMVEKRDGSTGKRQALFPECFQYLLDTQLSDGSWSAYSCDLDGILNSMAALLALKRRSASLEAQDAGLDARCIRAEDALQHLMDSWDVGSCDRVGFEIIVPALLRLLQEVGVEINFPARDALMELCDAKTAKLYPMLYDGPPSTLTHSLEAFAGKLDFDRVKHHASPYGAMLASPSSTAASLIYSTEWDDRAENFLRQVVDATGRTGGVPSAFPTTIFELSWASPLKSYSLSGTDIRQISTTLLEAGFTQEELGTSNLTKVAQVMSHNLAQQNGIVGFAPYCLPDVDDTATAISVLGLMGEHLPLDALCDQYETPSHFLTYRGERNPSFSANCNVLLCLLRRPDVFEHTPRVAKCTRFLCELWYQGRIKDKWNNSDHYPMMLLSKAFIMLLSRWEKGDMKEEDIPIDLISERVPIVLMDILIRTLDSQASDGSWDSLNEVTAYALLTIAHLSRVPWFQSISTEISYRIEQARHALQKNQDNWSNAEYLWIEKVAYSSSTLSNTYCLAAMKATEDTQLKHMLGDKVDSLVRTPAKMVKKMAGFFSKVPMFVNTPLWKLEVSVKQALQFVPALTRIRLDIFPRKSVGKDEYLQYIPFTWVSIGNGSIELSLESQWEMMVTSMLIYHVDEFMEAFVAHELADNIDAVRQIVRRHCDPEAKKVSKKRPREDQSDDERPATKPYNGVPEHANGNRSNESAMNGTKNGTSNGIPNGASGGSLNENTNGLPNVASNGATNSAIKIRKANGIASNGTSSNGITANGSSSTLQEADRVLGHFIKHMRTHPKVAKSAPWLQHWLCQEIEAFLLAHLTHIADCHAIARQPTTNDELLVYSEARSTYFDWVRTTTADTTGGTFAFPFYICLLDNTSKSAISNPVVRYITQDASRHLATLCRQENDAGSLKRDLKEQNLNSVNFLEFNLDASRVGGAADAFGQRAQKVKKKLLEVADYERTCLDKALSDLERLVDPKLSSLVRVFVNVTDLYGQLYQAKDVSASNLQRQG